VISWWRSASEAAELAKASWIRVVANKELGAYEMYQAGSKMADPEWPPHTFDDLVLIGFRDHYIGDLSHAAVKQLRGLV
jgi:hypothetical protein